MIFTIDRMQFNGEQLIAFEFYNIDKEKKNELYILEKVDVLNSLVEIGFDDFYFIKYKNDYSKFWIENKNKKISIDSVYKITYKTALLIGLVQCLAMIPGTSRSAATIIGAMLLGCSRGAAAEFSFFLAIPTMFGATLLKLAKMFLGGTIFTAWQWVLLFLGCVFSFIVALLVIKLFLNYVQKHDFKVFGYYRIALSSILLVYFFFIK